MTASTAIHVIVQVLSDESESPSESRILLHGNSKLHLHIIQVHKVMYGFLIHLLFVKVSFVSDEKDGCSGN